MPDSPEPNDEVTDDITPEVLAAAMKISAAKVRCELPPAPKCIAQQIRRYGRRTVQVRQVAAILSALLAMASVCNCYLTVPLGWVFSVLGVMAAFSLPLLVLKEFLSGAGAHVQSQFRQGKTYFREFSFEPSVQTFGSLALLLLISTFGLVLGFASIYASMIRLDPKSIAGASGGFGAIYFSVVTFATVGFGDNYPTTTLSKTVVVVEILLAWGLFALVFSALISWLSSNIQRMHEAMLSQEEREMQARESAMKAAGVGLYRGESGFDKPSDETKRKVAQTRKK